MPPEILQHAPGSFELWPQLWPAALVFLGTFVLEDAAAISAGLLIAAGLLAWPVAFAACFLGIWAGDVGLYAFARTAGRKAFEWSSLRRFSGRVGQSERWFAARGPVLLISSRVIPGARLPTYLAAGFLRLPFNQFLAVTGGAALVWTTAILFLTQLVGARLLPWLDVFHRGGWLLLVATLAMLALLHFAKKLFRPRA